VRRWFTTLDRITERTICVVDDEQNAGYGRNIELLGLVVLRCSRPLAARTVRQGGSAASTPWSIGPVPSTTTSAQHRVGSSW
jgi:hypothetical protein